MKFLIFAVLLLATFATESQKLQGPLIDQALDKVVEKITDNVFDSVTNVEQKEKATACIVESVDQVRDIISLAKNIAQGALVDSIQNVVSITKRFFSMLDNCSVLFCFGPTYEKCEAQNPQGCEQTGLIIYPKCAEGFTNWGSNICANECPNEFKDNGLFCLKPKAYGRGAGYAIWDENKCKSRNPQGCEKNGAMWYPKCRPGYHNVGCCVCSPNCPSGMTDIGISCAKPDTYGRGVGYPVSFGLQCLDREQKLQASYVNCEDLQVDITMLEIEVENKLAYLEAYPGSSLEGFVDEVKQLGEKVEKYANHCQAFDE